MAKTAGVVEDCEGNEDVKKLIAAAIRVYAQCLNASVDGKILVAVTREGPRTIKLVP